MHGKLFKDIDFKYGAYKSSLCDSFLTNLDRTTQPSVFEDSSKYIVLLRAQFEPHSLQI